MSEWQQIESAPDGTVIETMIKDDLGVRNVRSLTKKGRLWWSGAVYVYYAPTHWRPLSEPSSQTTIEKDTSK